MDENPMHRSNIRIEANNSKFELNVVKEYISK